MCDTSHQCLQRSMQNKCTKQAMYCVCLIVQTFIKTAFLVGYHSFKMFFFFLIIILSNVVLQYTKNTSVQYNVDITNKLQLHI